MQRLNDAAAALPSTGAVYRHGKSGRTYLLHDLVFRESDCEVCAVYHADGKAALMFVRPLSEFLSKYTATGE